MCLDPVPQELWLPSAGYKCELCSVEAMVSTCSSLFVWKHIDFSIFYPDVQPPSSSDTPDDSSSESQEDSDGDSTEGDENDEPLSLEWPESRKKQAIYLFLFPIVFPLWSTLPDVRNPVRIHLPSASGVINWAIDFLWARVPGSIFPCLESPCYCCREWDRSPSCSVMSFQRLNLINHKF